MLNFNKLKHRIKGFSLVELTIVLLVVGMLFSGMITVFTRYVAQARIKQVRSDQQLIVEALYGSAIRNGYLPCPDTDGDGSENRVVATGLCASDQSLLPAADLGVPAIDPWGTSYFYAVDATYSTAPPGAIFSFVSPVGGMSIVDTVGAGGVNIATGVVALVFSAGANRATVPADTASADEAENVNLNAVFVNKNFDPNYDDIISWISTPVIIAKMVDAEQLP